MNKKIVCLALAMVFALSTAGIGFAAKLAPGDKIKVSPAKKATVEGC